MQTNLNNFIGSADTATYSEGTQIHEHTQWVVQTINECQSVKQACPFFFAWASNLSSEETCGRKKHEIHTYVVFQYIKNGRLCNE